MHFIKIIAKSFALLTYLYTAHRHHLMSSKQNGGLRATYNASPHQSIKPLSVLDMTK